MKVDAGRVIERRRKERRNLIARAQELADQLEPGLGLRGLVVFGSVARGDFNVWRDIDVLVVAEHLPERWLDRIDVLGSPPPLVQPVVWTPEEYRAQIRRGNPIALEAAERGVWLVGGAAQLACG